MIALDVDTIIGMAMMETYNIISRVMRVPQSASKSIVPTGA
jgi:hypothetical protein